MFDVLGELSGLLDTVSGGGLSFFSSVLRDTSLVEFSASVIVEIDEKVRRKRSNRHYYACQ